MKCEGKKTEVRSRVFENLRKAFQPKHSMVINFSAERTIDLNYATQTMKGVQSIPLSQYIERNHFFGRPDFTNLSLIM